MRLQGEGSGPGLQPPKNAHSFAIQPKACPLVLVILSQPLDTLQLLKDLSKVSTNTEHSAYPAPRPRPAPPPTALSSPLYPLCSGHAGLAPPQAHALPTALHLPSARNAAPSFPALASSARRDSLVSPVYSLRFNALSVLCISCIIHLPPSLNCWLSTVGMFVCFAHCCIPSAWNGAWHTEIGVIGLLNE